MKEEIVYLENFQCYCTRLLSIFSQHNRQKPKELSAIEGAIVYLIERFNSVVHSLPALFDVYYKNNGVNSFSIFSVLRSFCLDAIQVCEYAEIVGNGKGKDEATLKGELNEIASRHFCDKMWDLIKRLNQDSDDFKTILNNYPYCFIKNENGQWQNAYNNRVQPNQVCVSISGLNTFSSKMMNLYETFGKVEHFQMIGFGIIRTPELIKNTVSSIIKNDMVNYLRLLVILYEGAFENGDISKPILEALNNMWRSSN